MTIQPTDQPTDYFLVKATFPTLAKRDAGEREVVDAAALMSQLAGTALSLTRVASALDLPLMYLYLKLPSRTPMDAGTLAALEMVLGMTLEANLSLSRLQLGLAPDCPSKDMAPLYHYVVETDTDEGWWDEIIRWYDTEHMPGLAQVPGCIRAQRHINVDAAQGTQGASPRSLACYDLTSPDVLTSPEWLAVRHTAWSDIARPHFKNTLRTMMRVVAHD